MSTEKKEETKQEFSEVEMDDCFEEFVDERDQQTQEIPIHKEKFYQEEWSDDELN